MICEPCKIGGRLMAFARSAPLAERLTLMNVARADHEKCQAPKTCPCHHVIELDEGKVIR